MNDITKQPYSKWLEESLKVISEFKPACLCIAATSPRQMGGEGGLGGKVGCGGSDAAAGQNGSGARNGRNL